MSWPAVVEISLTLDLSQIIRKLFVRLMRGLVPYRSETLIDVVLWDQKFEIFIFDSIIHVLSFTLIPRVMGTLFFIVSGCIVAVRELACLDD